MIRDAFQALHIVEVLALADDIDAAVEADHDDSGTVGDELHALRDVVGADGMHDEMIAGGHGGQGDLLTDDIDVHAETAVELHGLRGSLAEGFGGLHIEAIPVAAVEQVDAGIDDIRGSRCLMDVSGAFVGFSSERDGSAGGGLLHRDDAGDEITGLIDECAAAFEVETRAAVAWERVQHAGDGFGILLDGLHELLGALIRVMQRAERGEAAAEVQVAQLPAVGLAAALHERDEFFGGDLVGVRFENVGADVCAGLADGDGLCFRRCGG